MTRSPDPTVIVSYARTPIGALQGALAPLSAPALGGASIAETMKRVNLPVDQVDEVLMGCVLCAGLGQNPARQATLGAGLPQNTPATTVSKVCGSGMRAIMLADTLLQANQANIVIAGGMESMTNAPYLIPKARSGYRMGHDRLIDHMFFDGLEDAYSNNKLMGNFADQTAKKYAISREAQDTFALQSLQRANQATSQGWFNNELVPLTIQTRKTNEIIRHDEIPTQAKPDKIPKLKPAFNADGTVTAANASSIADGAAALLLMKTSTANQHGLTPLAQIIGQCAVAIAPEWFTTAPIEAIKSLLTQIHRTTQDVDLYEINEAFAVVTLSAIHALQLDPNTVNPFGGACALGHPIGASGARIVCTLLSALQQQKKSLGIASLCIGGGEATALAIENLG